MLNSPLFVEGRTRKFVRRIWQSIRCHLGLFSKHPFNYLIINKKAIKLISILGKKLFLDFVILYFKSFIFRIKNLHCDTSFQFRFRIFVKWCRTFCHMIKLIKYHVTKRPGRSLGVCIQRHDSMSEPGKDSEMA